MTKSLTARVVVACVLFCTVFPGWSICRADDFYVIPIVKQPPATYPAPVPETFQVGCMDESGNYRECSGTGEDYEYEAGVEWPYPRFEAAPGGYRDRLTGLIWQANTHNGPMKWEDALKFCNDLIVADLETFSIYDDWRLPNIRELQSLINYGRSDPALPMPHPFVMYAGASFWWSSTTNDWTKDEAWYVRFGDGKVDNEVKTNDSDLRAWCVRAGL